MGEQLFDIVVTALAIAPITTGIVNKIKANSSIEGLTVIAMAIIIAMGLTGLVASVFDFPLAESLLVGFMAGWASVGAFEGFEHAKEFIE